MYTPAGSGLSGAREDTEGDTKRSRRGHRADRGRGKRRPRDSESSFISPNSAVSGEGPDRPHSWRTAYLGHDAVGQERAGAAGREREKVTGALVSFPRKGPSPPHALGGGAAPGTTATHQDGRAQTADEEGTDAHAEGQGSTPRLGATETPWPAQPDPAPPRHAPAKAAHPPRPRPQLRCSASSALSQPLSRTPNYGPFLAGPTLPTTATSLNLKSGHAP